MDQIYKWNCDTHLSTNSFNPSLKTMAQCGALQYLALLTRVVTKTLFKLKLHAMDSPPLKVN